MKIKLTVIVIILLASSLYTYAQTYVLQPDGVDGKDRAVRTNSDPFANLGTIESMNVYTWTNGSAKINKRALIEFDLSPFSSDKNLTNAKLSLYFNPVDNYESVDEHSGDNAFFIERNISPWEEDVLAWETKPHTTSQNRVEVSQSTDSQQNYLDIDVTQLVKDMLNDPENSHGFTIKMQNETDPYRMVILATSDHPRQRLHPRLELEFGEITSINQLKEAAIDITVFPNPIEKSHKIVLKSPMNPTNELRFVLFDALGKTIFGGNIHNQIQELSTDKLESAIYFLSIYDQKGNNTTKKIVVF